MDSSSNSANFNYVQNLIPVFDGENYEFWSLQMETLFISQDFWDLVEDSYEDPSSTKDFES